MKPKKEEVNLLNKINKTIGALKFAGIMTKVYSNLCRKCKMKVLIMKRRDRNAKIKLEYLCLDCQEMCKKKLGGYTE